MWPLYSRRVNSNVYSRSWSIWCCCLPLLFSILPNLTFPRNASPRWAFFDRLLSFGSSPMQQVGSLWSPVEVRLNVKSISLHLHLFFHLTSHGRPSCEAEKLTTFFTSNLNQRCKRCCNKRMWHFWPNWEGSPINLESKQSYINTHLPPSSLLPSTTHNSKYHLF